MNYNQKKIIEFINSEKIDKTQLDKYKVYRFFCKCYAKTLMDLYSKFNIKHSEKLSYIISGSNIMNYIYWHILSYTNNLRLALFLSERAILLFTEFLLLTKDPNMNRQFLFLPNLNDAIAFVFERTIGDLKINTDNCSHLTSIRIAGLCIKNIQELCFIELYDKATKNNNFILHFDFIINYISNIIFIIYSKIYQDIDNIDYYIQNIISKIYIKNLDINTKLYLIKNFLDSFLKLYNQYTNIKQILNILEISLNDTLIYINSKNNINNNLIANYFKKQIKKNYKNNL